MIYDSRSDESVRRLKTARHTAPMITVNPIPNAKPDNHANNKR